MSLTELTEDLQMSRYRMKGFRGILGEEKRMYRVERVSRGVGGGFSVISERDLRGKRNRRIRMHSLKRGRGATGGKGAA